MNLTFEQLRFANVQRNKEWDPDNKINGTFRGLELAGEVGELCNMIKKLERERMGLIGSRVSFVDFAKEVADVQICIDLLAMHYSIDLAVVTSEKFNASSDKHGFETKLPAKAFLVCNDCSTTGMCTQEEYCDRLPNGYR